MAFYCTIRHVMRNIRLIIGYDGTSFHGWQFQPGTRTVEGELVAGLSRVLREPVKLLAASRTDSGVHARGQAAFLVALHGMGGHGEGANRMGPRGDEKIVRVPLGTQVWAGDSLVADLTVAGRRILVAAGGQGGWDGGDF